MDYYPSSYMDSDVVGILDQWKTIYLVLDHAFCICNSQSYLRLDLIVLFLILEPLRIIISNPCFQQIPIR